MAETKSFAIVGGKKRKTAAFAAPSVAVADYVPRGPRITIRKGGTIPLSALPISVRPEVKRKYNVAFWDAETMDYPPGTASQQRFFNNIAQGLAADSRVGDTIYVKMLKIRGLVQMNVTSSSTNAMLALVEDTEPAAGVPAWTDVFQGIGGAGNASYCNAIMNYDKRPRFRLRRFKRIPLSWTAAYYNAGAVASARAVPFEMTVKVNRLVKYDNTNAPYKGSEYYLFGWSDLAANTPLCSASYQIWFTDS